MSLLATSYRFENESCNLKSLQKALARQQSRINEDEKYAEREKTVDTEKMINEVSKWSENLEEASDRRKAKSEREEVKEELRLGSKASIMVRRAQLHQLLLTEHAQYEQELKKLGMAFYQERL